GGRALRAGVLPLAGALGGPARRPAVRPGHAGPDPGADAAAAWRAGPVHAAALVTRLRRTRRRAVPVAAHRLGRPLPARGGSGPVQPGPDGVAGRPGTGTVSAAQAGRD